MHRRPTERTSPYASEVKPVRKVKKKTKTEIPKNLLKKRSTRSASFVAGLFFVFVFVYMIYAAFRHFSPEIATVVVRMESQETPTSVQGLIVRYEQVYTSDRSGRVVFSIGNYERVNSGTHIAVVQDVNTIGTFDRTLADIETDIISLRDRMDSIQIGPMIDHFNVNLQNIVNANTHHFTLGNTHNIHVLHDSLQQISTRRNNDIISVLGNVVPEHQINYENINNEFEMNATNIYARSSGIMSPLLDGFEEEFIPERLRYLTRDEVRRVVDYSMLAPTRDVSEDEPVFKVVSNTWYVVAYMPNEMVEDFVVDTTRVVYLLNANTGLYQPISMRIISMYSDPRETLIVFRSNRNVIDFLNQRNVSLRTSHNVRHGLQIPYTSIVTRVYYRIPHTHIHDDSSVLISNGQRRVPISIAEYTDYHAYVTTGADFTLGDSLLPQDIIHPSFLLTESSVVPVHGVYRATMGFANFIRIHLDDDIYNIGNYILLDPSSNFLRQFDSIVVDASSVHEGMILK